jgi:anaerobic selenocysteine-containing dehydrogenase
VEQRLDRLVDLWGERTPYIDAWPERVDSRTLDEPDHWVQSACTLCSNGCALDIGVKNGVIVGVRGRAVDRVNRGRLGPKGLYGWESSNAADRLRRPLIRQGKTLKPASWDEAMALIVQRTREIRDTFTSQAIGFYTSGQLFLEDYYTQVLVARAGLGTPHLDGNTRLCTATASEALKQSFGADGQPGSYEDFDTADALFHIGQNLAETKTVLWSRILDRRRGPNPPKMVVADPRRTLTASEADVHLPLRSGTNLPLMYGLLHLLIESGAIDWKFIDAHTVGFEGLQYAVRPWTPKQTEAVTGVPVDLLRKAASILGSAERLVSTVLQGVYQSAQATASAVQVNNLHLIRGMIGRPGCAVFQMNGQPTAQNTRETGCDGGMPGFRNWNNPAHMDELAQIWNIDPQTVARWRPPTPAMEIFRLAEIGSLKMLWITATNPAVSMPELARIRKILSGRNLFVVVNDAFPTETTDLADVVLPAALWGEKTGTFTNSDRTVHLSMKAVEPPGEARPDYEIFLDFARRMDFRDKDGAPLIKFSDPEGAFEAWKSCSRGRPCDYRPISYDALREGSGIQWGGDRLYKDGKFATDAAYCQTYGHDLNTGAALPPEKYKAANPEGRAILRTADVEATDELPDDDYPFRLTTGRQVFHFHTRTRTGRSEALNRAAPEVVIQIAAEDAAPLGIASGSLVEVETRRGKIQGPVAIAQVAPGHLFVPFHYGYWDKPEHARAANELTRTAWDPVSKQPYFKEAAARLRKIDAYSLAPEQATVSARKVKKGLFSRPHLPDYLGILEENETAVAQAAMALRERHPKDPEIVHGSRLIEQWALSHVEALKPLSDRFGIRRKGEGKKLRKVVLESKKPGGFGVVRDLHDLWVLTQGSKVAAIIVLQAAHSLRDLELESALQRVGDDHERQIAWILTRLKNTAAQALVVPS